MPEALYGIPAFRSPVQTVSSARSIRLRAVRPALHLEVCQGALRRPGCNAKPEVEEKAGPARRQRRPAPERQREVLARAGKDGSGAEGRGGGDGVRPRARAPVQAGAAARV